MHPQVLVVGGSRVGKKALTARLLGRPAAQPAQAEQWFIDTKYYTAQASVVLRSPSTAEGEDWQVLAHAISCVPLHRAEGENWWCWLTQSAMCLHTGRSTSKPLWISET